MNVQKNLFFLKAPILCSLPFVLFFCIYDFTYKIHRSDFEIVIYGLQNSSLNFFYKEFLASVSVFPLAFLTKELYLLGIERPVFVILFFCILAFTIQVLIFGIRAY